MQIFNLFSGDLETYQAVGAFILLTAEKANAGISFPWPARKWSALSDRDSLKEKLDQDLKRKIKSP